MTSVLEDHIGKRETRWGQWLPVIFYLANYILWLITGIAALHLTPPSVVLNTLLTPPVPAHSVIGSSGSIAKAVTLGPGGKPLLAALQLAPASPYS